MPVTGAQDGRKLQRSSMCDDFLEKFFKTCCPRFFITSKVGTDSSTGRYKMENIIFQCNCLFWPFPAFASEYKNLCVQGMESSTIPREHLVPKFRKHAVRNGAVDHDSLTFDVFSYDFCKLFWHWSTTKRKSHISRTDYKFWNSRYKLVLTASSGYL